MPSPVASADSTLRRLSRVIRSALRSRPYNRLTLALAPGARLGPYEILSALGAGGMGEVYRARDTKLEREVAIKVLPERRSPQDPERLAAFEREAKVLASLNHPHIAPIYGLGGSRAAYRRW